MMRTDIDTQVAVKVMDSICLCEKDSSGWSIHGYGSAGGVCYNCSNPHYAPKYSTDIAAAFQVVEKLRAKWFTEDPNETNYWQFEDYADEGWCVQIVWPHHDGDIQEVGESADTLPMAICLAALKTIESK